MLLLDFSTRIVMAAFLLSVHIFRGAVRGDGGREPECGEARMLRFVQHPTHNYTQTLHRRQL